MVTALLLVSSLLASPPEVELSPLEPGNHSCSPRSSKTMRMKGGVWPPPAVRPWPNACRRAHRL